MLYGGAVAAGGPAAPVTLGHGEGAALVYDGAEDLVLLPGDGALVPPGREEVITAGCASPWQLHGPTPNTPNTVCPPVPPWQVLGRWVHGLPWCSGAQHVQHWLPCDGAPPGPTDWLHMCNCQGMWMSTVAKMLAPYSAHLSSHKQLLSNFNSIIANKTFIFL